MLSNKISNDIHLQRPTLNDDICKVVSVTCTSQCIVFLMLTDDEVSITSMKYKENGRRKKYSAVNDAE